MDSWWSEIDGAVLACFSGPGVITPAEIGHKLGITEEAACSILSMLATEGKVRIRAVERTQGRAQTNGGGQP